MTPELEEAFYYIIDAGRHKNYDDAMECITQNLRNPNEILQIAALQALQLLNPRVWDIENKLILPILFENLKSNSGRILHETMDTLSDIAYLIPQLKREIYLAYFENGIDFFTETKLKKFTNKSLIHSLNNEEEKVEFILSFCQNSKNYQEALEVCLYFLKKNESEEINIAIFQGISYILLRFQKIDFDIVLPFIKKFLNLKGREYVFVESFLVDITTIMPGLQKKAIQLLKSIESPYLTRLHI